MSEQAYMIISIGPIQDFIASARRCQDLWYGSWLLSHLAKRISQKVKNLCGADALIIPGNEDLEGNHSVSNKIVAVVPAESVKELAAECQKVVDQELIEQLEQVLERIPERFSQYLHEEVAFDQVRDMIEMFWVSVPCVMNEGSKYVETRQRAEQLLAARKNTRAWKHATWGSDAPKSSLDGARESVIDEKLYEHIQNEVVPGVTKERARKAFGIRPAERLCGIGLLKRGGMDLISSTFEVDYPKGKDRPVFHSTSHMAASPLFDHFERKEVRQAFDSYLHELMQILGHGEESLQPFRIRQGPGLRGEKSNVVYDGLLLFDNRLRDLIESYSTRPKQDLVSCTEHARMELEKFLRVLGKVPSPYYVMIMADGDRMGQLIDAQDSLVRHRQLSQSLDGFARQATVIVNKHSGSPIYTGGDDLLALLPLHTAISCARELADSFAQRMAKYSTKMDGETLEPSLSVGLAIAHHLTHFSGVREQAREAERLAKTRRNSLGIIIDKRSGGRRSVIGEWKTKNATMKMLPLDERLTAWQKLMAESEISHGFIHEIDELVRLADPVKEKAPIGVQFSKMLLYEMERVMGRKEPGALQEVGFSEEVKATLRHYVEGQSHKDVADGLIRLSSELYLAREIQQVVELTNASAVHDRIHPNAQTGGAA